MRRLRSALSLLPHLVLLAITLLGAVQAHAQTPLDSARVELVRSRGFVRGSDTQLSRTLERLDAAVGTTCRDLYTGARTICLTEVGRDSLRAELVRSRGSIRASDTQLSKTLQLVDAARETVMVLPIDAAHRAVASLPAGPGWARIQIDSAGVVVQRDSLWLEH